MSVPRNLQLANLPAMNNATLILTIDSSGASKTLIFNKLVAQALSDYGVVLDPNEITGLLVVAGDAGSSIDLALSIGSGAMPQIVIPAGQSLYLPIQRSSAPGELRYAHLDPAGGDSSVMVFR